MSHEPAEWDVQETLIARLRREVEVRDDELAMLRGRLNAAEHEQDSTLLVIGDVVGHGLQAGRRAAFVRTTFAATAPFSDDPWRLLSWANTALVERAGTSPDFVTAACVTLHPRERMLRWAYAGHPPAAWLHNGQELVAPSQRPPLGLEEDSRLCRGVASTAGPRGSAALHRRADRGQTRRQLLRHRGRQRRPQRAPRSLPG